ADVNITWQNETQQFIHFNLNNVSTNTTMDRCWGCHIDDPNGDAVINESEVDDRFSGGTPSEI
ncbi:MAG: hypothetical protein GWN12_10305, partial [Thermoplasmata archaeon]|nr:hypothetical protein [Thermoplasmata archaeon]NIT80120.1 hypothetical protein [Thermoplasmata archaeon]NIW89151.1 hypothetical protein [Thermoplasmata archaeon]NIY06488.1 hypothetical protein [Thermoplasmata archaeon]